MSTVNIGEARARLSSLVSRAERGEEVVIARRGKPAVRLVACASSATAKPKRRRQPGALKGRRHIPDSAFFDPLPEEELRAWEGRSED